jgi:putative Holliday junction resolvase
MEVCLESMKVLAIDYGLAKIGLAIGESDLKIASPLAIWKNDSHFFDRLKELVATERIEKIIVGMPSLGLDGQTGWQEQVENFLVQLGDNLNIPVEAVNEQFSTAQAKRLAHGGNDDDLAAMVFLQTYFDSGLTS